MKHKPSLSIYNQEVHADDELNAALKKCFLNHMLIYNYSLDLLTTTPDISFKKLKDDVYDYSKANKFSHMVYTAIMNELYYQYKKFKSGGKGHKLITDIQYLTIITKGYKNKILNINNELMTISIDKLPGKFTLDKHLPDIQPGSTLYFNFSYSNITDGYMMSIFLG